jgi:trimeric autotransporter adhesin
MATKIWRGTARAVPQVDTVTPALINPGDTFTLTINRKDISVTARTDTTVQGLLIADVVAKMVAAIGQYSNTEPEFAEVSASAGVDGAGNTTHLILTGPTDGKPFTATAAATASTLRVTITEVRRGAPGRNAKQLLVPRGTYTGGTFDLVYDGATISGVAYNATAATLQTAINAGKETYSPSVTVSGPAGGPYTIETSSGVPVITVSGGSLTGGDFVEVLAGQDGQPAGLTLRIARDSAATADTQYRLTLGTDPGRTGTTAWIESTAGSEQIAYALLSAGFFAAVKPSADVDSLWDIELISDLQGASAATIQATIESNDSSYEIEEVTRIATNEVQYVRINAVTGNITIGATNVAVNGADFFANSATAGSLAKAILDETGLANTVAKVGSAPTNTQGLIKVEFTGGIEVAPLLITDGSLAGGCFDNVILDFGLNPTDEIQRVGFNRAPTGGTFTLTYSGQTTGTIAYNATAATVQAALEALSNIGAGEAIVTGATGGPWDVRFDGTLGAVDTVAMTGNGASLTGGTTPTYTLASFTAPEGPNWFSVADNWYNPAAPGTPTIPASGDTIVYRQNSVDCLYDLDDQAATTFASVIIEASYTGKIGLPEYTGTYYEYRPRRLKCGMTLLEIGRGLGSGSSRLNLDLSNIASTVTVFGTGASQDNTPALQIAGTSSSNVYRVLDGSVGIGTGDHADTVAGNTLVIGSGPNTNSRADVLVMGGTITTIEQIGGSAAIRCSATTLNARAGNLTIDGAPTFTTVNCRSNILARSTGTITTLHLGKDGRLDLSANAAGLTITNCNVYAGASFFDPWRKATLTNGLNLVQCGFQDVQVNAGSNIVTEVSQSVGIL